MTSTTLDYSSWLFQFVCVVAIVYLAVGLSNPALVRASRRSTVAIVAALVLLLASSAFYMVASKLPGGKDTASEIKTDMQQQAPPQP
jgi:uncharacterized membrane protein YGL010W